MTATVIWRPEPLTARLIAAARPAAQEVGRAAQIKAASASKRVAASIRVTGTTTDFAIAATNPLAPLIEKGARPHEIEPRNKVLRLADGRFVTGPVRHPGIQARPFLRPSLVLWPTAYRRTASVAFRGF